LLPGAFCYARFAALQRDFLLAAGNDCPPQYDDNNVIATVVQW
jgi:hypothetical protein